MCEMVSFPMHGYYGALLVPKIVLHVEVLFL